MITQIAVFVENRPGQMKQVLKTLSEGGINMNGLSVADTSEFGILRIIVSDPEKAAGLLQKNGYIVKRSEVLAIEVSDQPGALYEALEVLDQEHINIEYVYAFGTKMAGSAMIILKTDDALRSLNALNNAGIKVLDEAMMYERLNA